MHDKRAQQVVRDRTFMAKLSEQRPSATDASTSPIPAEVFSCMEQHQYSTMLAYGHACPLECFFQIFFV
jgi:hypothetical protein